MATNNLQGVFATRIARLTLDALLTMDLPIYSFVNDFSPDIAAWGNAVTTRYPNTPLTVSDFSSTKATQNANTTPRTITLDKYVGVGLEFTDQEIAYSDVALLDMFVKPALSAIFENVMATAFALVTPGNFSSNVNIAPTAFTANNVASVSNVQTTAKVPLSPRKMIINPSYAQTLKTDPSVQAAYAYGPGNTIRTGVIPEVHGYDIFEWNGTIPNSNNLAGIAFNPLALLLAARTPVLPRNWYGEVRNITAPNTGLTIQLRDFYDGNKQVTQWSLIYGMQIGQAGALTRICNGSGA